MKKLIIIGGIIVVLVIGYRVLDNFLFDEVKPIAINNTEFQGKFYAKDGVEKQTTIVIIGGGAWGDYWANSLASQGFVGLSLPYSGKNNLPKIPEGIRLEYFEKAFNWLVTQPEVNPGKIIVMGASRNAELALVIASTLDEYVDGVIAYSPSSVSWSNTVVPYNSDEVKASWKYRNKDIPYISMEKIKGNDKRLIETLSYWNIGLSKVEEVEKAAI